ncbi:MAG TPA: hypothetical protein VN032_09705 [Thermoanaerobaculia bacterium]|nr:hypothetical protein [Thermoanaerobaculia bacterium]
MRRLSGLFGLILFLAPMALALATAADESAAMRCAIACGHAMGATKGAACCPMSDAPDAGPVLKTCSRGADAAIAPLSFGPVLLAVSGRLPAPDGSRPLDTMETPAPRSAFLRAAEKVPLLAG